MVGWGSGSRSGSQTEVGVDDGRAAVHVGTLVGKSNAGGFKVSVPGVARTRCGLWLLRNVTEEQRDRGL